MTPVYQDRKEQKEFDHTLTTQLIYTILHEVTFLAVRVRQTELECANHSVTTTRFQEANGGSSMAACSTEVEKSRTRALKLRHVSPVPTLVLGNEQRLSMP